MITILSRNIFCALALLISLHACAQPLNEKKLTTSKRMADSEMTRTPDPTLLDFAKAPKWTYTNGLVCLAIQRLGEETGDPKYFAYGEKYADYLINEDGTIKTYKPEDYNIDMINSGKILFALLERTKNPKYEKAIQLLRNQMRNHPRTSEGGFWHKKVYPHQMWLDGLYMGSPFLAQYAKTYNEPALFDDVANQITLVAKHTYDSSTNLFFHAWDESREQRWANKETGKSPHAWGRAMGWYAMALVDVLDYFPKEHPSYQEILSIVNKMARSIAEAQDKKSGLWFQVMDEREREGNYLESSASTMFTYFLLKGLNKGYLPAEYKKTAIKGYEGIQKKFITEEKGLVSINDACAVAGLGGNPYRDGSFEYYINEPRRSNDAKAVGPYILMGIEYEKLAKK